jgi:hypothetical protein
MYKAMALLVNACPLLRCDDPKMHDQWIFAAKKCSQKRVKRLA